MTFEAAIRLLGRTLRPLPEPLRVSAPVQLAPQSGPAGLGQIPSWWQAPLNDWVGWKTDWRLSSIELENTDFHKLVKCPK